MRSSSFGYLHLRWTLSHLAQTNPPTSPAALPFHPAPFFPLARFPPRLAILSRQVPRGFLGPRVFVVSPTPAELEFAARLLSSSEPTHPLHP